MRITAIQIGLLTLGTCVGVILSANANPSLPERKKNLENSSQTSPEVLTKEIEPQNQPRVGLDFVKNEGPAGITYIIEVATYADGTRVRRLSGLWLSNTPLPLRVVVADDFIPAPQKKTLQVSAKTPVTETSEKTSGQDVIKDPTPPSQTDEFPEGTQVTLRPLEKYLELENISPEKIVELKKACAETEKLGLVTIDAPNHKSASLIDTAAGNTSESIERDYFKMGAALCIGLVTTSGQK